MVKRGECFLSSVTLSADVHAAGLDRSIRHDRVLGRDPCEMAEHVSLDIDTI